MNRSRRAPQQEIVQHRRRLRPVLAALAAALVAVGAPAASAATTTAWATWTPLTGEAGSFTATMTLAGQPALTADITSDSRAGQVGVISGASTWLSEGTPIGEKYGSSRDQPYLNLRPRADSATSPSTTTYTFAAPTPSSGWAFALGDIDADSVRISGVSAAGDPLTADDLGFQGGFNYCAPGTAGKPSCTGDPDDVPMWDPASLTLMGNASASDTSGSAAWFEPAVPIVSLTFEFTQRSGFPVYQTWFASMARDITGTVRDVNTGVLDGVDVSLTDSNGTVIATTTTSGGGQYSFPGYFATDGYEVTATPPPGKTGVVTTGAADLRTQDAVVDLTVRDKASLFGTVTTAGDGTPGVAVTASGPDGVLTTTTDGDGNYAFPLIGDGTYEITITVPEGTVAVSPTTRTETVSGDDLSGVDFELARLGSVAGAVTDDAGAPIGGVTLTVDGPGGALSVITGVDGRYLIDELPPGDYVISVVAPDGTAVEGPSSRKVTITASGEAVIDQDFVLVADDVTAPPDDPDGPGKGGSGNDPLPTTGADSTPLLAGGVIALICGGALLLFARRRAV
ncbi:hypothetical protein GCM10025768_01190 [Microbacterium pseudoresistens]